MNEEQRAAFQQSQSACAMIEALGMQADNQRSIADGNQPEWTRRHFLDLIDRYGIGHNAAVTWLTGQ